MLRALFKKTFDIRDGEIRISFFMQIYIFLLITVLLMVKPTINALFLSNLGAKHLPYAYILVAIVALVTSFFYNRAIKRYSLRIITIATLVYFSICFLLLSILMKWFIINDWLLYVYYLSVSLFAVLVTSQFWIIANMVYNAREAKRLFGFIGAGAIAGGIFGGYLTTLLATAYGNRIVIFVASILILCCIPILQTVWKLRVKKLNTYTRNQRINAEKHSYNSPFRLILQSKHLTYLAAIVGVGVIMAKLVDFQFSDFANREIPDSDELASFFGFWFSSFNVIALLIQLFLTNRMLAWLGVTSNLLILPLGIAIGCLLFLTFPELWVLILIKGMDGSFKQSINKAGIELSILPIPYHVKNEAKSFIDVVVDSVATGIAGLMLIFIIRKLELSTSYITVIILLFLFVWIVLIYKLREAYFESFRTNIQNSLITTAEVTKKDNKGGTAKRYISVLSNGTEEEILSLLNRLQDFRLRSFEPHIVNLLNHPSNPVKEAAIEQLYFYRKGTGLEKIKELIHTKDDTVVFKAMEYLMQHTYIKDDSIFRSYLDHPVDYISNAAVLCLAKESSNNNKLAIQYDLNGKIETKIRELSTNDNDLRVQEIAELLLAVAYTKEPKYYSFISAHFNNIGPYVTKHAIKAAGITAHEPFIKNLLEFLSQKEYRKPAIKALRKYGVGITKTLLKMDISENLSEEIKPFVPKIIESFKSNDSIRILVRLLSSKDFIIRLEASKSLNEIKRKTSGLNLDNRMLTKRILKETKNYRDTINAIANIKRVVDTTVISENEDNDAATELLISRESLLELLYVQINQSLDCIFNLLSLKYNQTDIQTSYYGLKSDVRETKINALEFLDNLLHSRLKSRMLPLIEYHIIDNYEYKMTSFRIVNMKERTVLLKLLKNRGARLKQAVLNVMNHSQDPSYIKIINPYLKHNNKKVRLFAKSALSSLAKKAS